MNRRNFFSLIAGAIGGVIYAFNKPKAYDSFEKTTFKPKKPNPQWKYFYERYDFDTKTFYVIEDDMIIRTSQFEDCPFVFFGDMKEKIDSGLVKYVMIKKVRFIRT